MSPQLVILVLTVLMALILFLHELHDKKDSPKYIKLLLLAVLVFAITSAFFSYRSANENDRLVKAQIDTLALDLELARKSLDTANFIIRQQDLLAEELSKANDTIKSLQEERTAEILGG